MATYVMRGADRDVETPPVMRESDARVYAQQWADELGTPVILFRDDDGQLRHVDNVQPRPPTETDVTALAEVIAEAHEQGIRAGGYSLARHILNAGYRKENRK